MQQNNTRHPLPLNMTPSEYTSPIEIDQMMAAALEQMQTSEERESFDGAAAVWSAGGSYYGIDETVMGWEMHPQQRYSSIRLY